MSPQLRKWLHIEYIFNSRFKLVYNLVNLFIFINNWIRLECTTISEDLTFYFAYKLKLFSFESFGVLFIIALNFKTKT